MPQASMPRKLGWKRASGGEVLAWATGSSTYLMACFSRDPSLLTQGQFQSFCRFAFLDTSFAWNRLPLSRVCDAEISAGVFSYFLKLTPAMEGVSAVKGMFETNASASLTTSGVPAPRRKANWVADFSNEIFRVDSLTRSITMVNLSPAFWIARSAWSWVIS